MLPSTLAGIKCLTAQASANCSKMFKYYKDNISPVAPCVSVGGGGGGGGGVVVIVVEKVVVEKVVVVAVAVP